VSYLNRQGIIETLDALALELAGSQDEFELYLVGGAALVLAFGARESTKDVDAFAASPSPSMASSLRLAAERVANAKGLPTHWLNDAAKGFVHGLAPGEVVFERPPLRVRLLAPQQLLAMKLSAWRDDIDIADARLLMEKLRGNREETWTLVERHLVPGRELKARCAFDDLWEAIHGPH
jgi:hypothetical protein